MVFILAACGGATGAGADWMRDAVGAGADSAMGAAVRKLASAIRTLAPGAGGLACDGLAEFDAFDDEVGAAGAGKAGTVILIDAGGTGR
jgi:hypothetical protein